MKKEIQASVARMRDSTEKLFSENRFVVFLCGPTLDAAKPKASSALRKQVQELLISEGFEVVLGEDDGLEELRKDFAGMAHENELSFIQQESSAVVLIADSVGSYCELGLFSYHHYVENPNQYDFILLIDKKYEGIKSYLNEGPARAVDVMGGKVFHGDFGSFDLSPVLERLKARRTVYFTHGKGRPKGSGK
ncbi:MAG: hypothetical protein P1P93_08755 [Gammaproteobacteria bacterium]|nr:hypothetical protein [Gammaproteobacteria bacterium]